ncbi:hypothetical protein DH2020_034998 [Rehmannia glutinosa]|uniref:Retrotransposon Copia-like N-terminal domain-containing protein n=1 Tax=Rehmannia glutinosa TaxID=99300 RepID=A0ABR0V8M4_REHGL
MANGEKEGTTDTAASDSTGSSLQPVVHLQSQLVSVKLTESNYLIWEQQISTTVTGYGLEDFLTGKSMPPSKYVAADSESINPAYVSWVRQDQILASWLLSSLSESILITTVGLKSSYAIWNALKTNFASQTIAKVMQYRLQLQMLRKGTMPMREYLNKIKTCCDVLAAAGEPISDKYQVLYILGGLGSEYNPVLVSITSRITPCSLMETHALLLSFENRLEVFDNFQVSPEGSASINFTSQNPRRAYNNQGNRGRGFPNHRGKGGGRGPFRGRGGRQNGMRCQICYKTNHTADKCFYWANLNYVPNSPTTNYAQTPLPPPSPPASSLPHPSSPHISTPSSTHSSTHSSLLVSSPSSNSTIPLRQGELFIHLSIERNQSPAPLPTQAFDAPNQHPMVTRSKA